MEQPGTVHHNPFYQKSSHADLLKEEVVSISLMEQSAGFYSKSGHADFKRTIMIFSKGAVM